MTQPEALRLADLCNKDGYMTHIERNQIDVELRRLHALNAELVDVLRETLPILHDGWHEELEARVHRVLQKWEATNGS